MSEFRMDKNTTEHYSSLEELRAAWKCKPINRQTKDKNKLETQRNAFCKKHLCKACKHPMQFVYGTNTMICSNDNCKGVKITKADKEGNEIITYIPSFDLLDRLGSEIAKNIFTN